MIGRNDPCYCGSGKKYKKCHLKYDENLVAYEMKGYDIPQKKHIKNKAQIEGIRKSAVITKKLFDLLDDFVKEGVTTDEINALVHENTIKMGGTPAPLNYNGFPKSCCTSINDVVCHGIPENRVLKDGDIINIDLTTILDGYYSDSSRMYMIGNVSEKAKQLVEDTKKAMWIGIEQVKPYASIDAIGDAIQTFADSKGYGIVKDLGGHGVGVQFHEDPHIHHYRNNEKGMIMVPGMVFTIEPMINMGAYEVDILDDDWTVVTRDGSLSAQWEHTLLVTETGYEVLT